MKQIIQDLKKGNTREQGMEGRGQRAEIGGPTFDARHPASPEGMPSARLSASLPTGRQAASVSQSVKRYTPEV